MNSTKNNSLRVPYALAVHGKEEIERVVKVLEEHRTLMGAETAEFENSVAKKFGKKHGIMVNSGSSANTLAIELLDLPEGSEVITPILTFSTTVAPLIQKGLVPVFIDVVPGKYFINVDEIEKNITKKTKALMIPLLLGNIPNMEKLRKLADKYKLYLIEDSCDTLGGTYNGKPTGTYADISTTSFYGSHIITAGGGGGMILVDNDEWRDRAIIFRGWGRSSSLFKESENINNRFNMKVGEIQYDAKFVFGEIGYNFLPLEIGSAFGNAQIKKYSNFKKIREKNFKALHNFMKQYEQFFILPTQDPEVTTQWLCFPLTIKKDAPFTRLEITTFLETNNVQTRPVFTGNILYQPAFKNIPHRTVAKSYPATDHIMERGFVVGCHQGMEDRHIDQLKKLFTEFLSTYKSN